MRKLHLLFFMFIIFTNIATFAQELEEKEIEQQIKAQEKILKNTIVDIKTEKIDKYEIDEDAYKEKIDFLKNKISINKKAKNFIAVKRDELQLEIENERKLFLSSIKKIIEAKQEYKDKKYIENLLKNSIEKLQNNPLKSFNSIYEENKKSTNAIAIALSENYMDLYNQNHQYISILEYLKSNINLYRKSNFLIDNFNLEYFVTKIDEIEGISFISKLSSYYLKISVGEFTVILFIILFFRLLNLKIINFIANLIARLFVKSKLEDSENIRTYLKNSIDDPLIFSLYTFAAHLSALIIIKDAELIEKITPWINTVYMGLFTWALYAILNNSITIYAHRLLDKYPNVRKEMIVFVLRILKIILIVLVILFLFSQLGIDIKAIAASLGVGGIAIALASKDTLANFFGSLNIMTDNSFSQGDWIKTPDVEGTVVDIRMRTTRIRTFDNAMITIPNSQLANSHIMNWSKRKIGRRIKLSIGITYESSMKDIENLKKDIHTMLDTHPLIATERNATKNNTKKFEAIKKEDLQGIKRTLLVYIDEFGPSSIDILVYCFSRSPNWEDWLKVKEDVLIKIAHLVEKNSCEFAYPTQAILIKKDEDIATMQE